jgi:hypothetical protein
MLDAARADYQRQMEETKLKWAAEVTALKEAMARSQSQLTAELRSQKNVAASLGRELDAVHEELLKANAVIVEQQRKLATHDQVAELERQLSVAVTLKAIGATIPALKTRVTKQEFCRQGPGSPGAQPRNADARRGTPGPSGLGVDRPVAMRLNDDDS